MFFPRMVDWCLFHMSFYGILLELENLPCYDKIDFEGDVSYAQRERRENMETIRMTFNVLVKPEYDKWSAHCLELDIVAVADSEAQAIDDLRDLIAAQLEHALENDNMHNFYHAAPKRYWEEYQACTERLELQRDKVDDITDSGWQVNTLARLCHA